MTSIDEIKSLIDKHDGFSRLTRYKVILPSLYIGDDMQAMDAFCRRVTFPGKQINSFVKRTNQKEIQVANGYSVDNCQMLFSETNNQLIAKYMDFWIDSVVNPYDYLVEYRDYYARNIFLIKQNEQGETTYAMILKKAWPKNKLLIDYSDASMNTIAEQPVAFEYEDYEVVDHTLSGTINNIITRIRAQRLSVPISNAINFVRSNI